MSTDRLAGDLVRADEISWMSEPLPRLELLPVADLLALGPGELLEYTYDLQRELIAVRELLHAACGINARITTQRDRALDQLRRQRHRDTRTEPPA
jgi:hypothetical protein